MNHIQKKIFQNMSAERKWQLSVQLNYNARALKAAVLRKEHPEWDEEKIQAEVKRIFLHAST